MMRVVAAVALLALVLVGTPQPTFGCICRSTLGAGARGAERSKVRVARQEAVAVFAGEVLDTTVDAARGVLNVRLRVDRAWKGVRTTEVIVATGLDDCGFSFDAGAQYLVYCSGNAAQLTTSLCHRTRLLTEAQSDLRYLGRKRLR